jgi:hypothetical protein
MTAPARLGVSPAPATPSGAERRLTASPAHGLTGAPMSYTWGQDELHSVNGSLMAIG